eukprot:TRINITY_DN44103_c0_g1_i1.p1 TRINITY_DN44103_c0_g1~~TRINITY_DN44103_c0_g1_i1.p1  ORF type:complete len:748 (-),score=82.47 TRINITY_DN44103_c0_g1_i1:59-2236(-)
MDRVAHWLSEFMFDGQCAALERRASRHALHVAAEGKDVFALKCAIDRAKASDVDQDVISEAERVLRKEEAQVCLQNAMSSRDVEALKSTIGVAKVLDVNSEVIANAELILRTEEVRRQLIDAVSQNDPDDLCHALAAAASTTLSMAELFGFRVSMHIMLCKHFVGRHTPRPVGLLCKLVYHCIVLSLDSSAYLFSEHLCGRQVAFLERMASRHIVRLAVMWKDTLCLEVAVERAKSAQLSLAEIKYAEDALQDCTITSRLKTAQNSADVCELQRSIQAAQDIGFQGRVLERAECRLQKEEARNEIKAALAVSDVLALEEAIHHAQSSSLGSFELAFPNVVLRKLRVKTSMAHFAARCKERLGKTTVSVAGASRSDSDRLVAQRLQARFLAQDEQARVDRQLAQAIGAADSDHQVQRVLMGAANPTVHGGISSSSSAASAHHAPGRCSSCMESKLVVTVACKHSYCEECLRQLFENACNDRTLIPVRCCREQLDLQHAARVLSIASFDLLRDRTEEQNAKDKMYCPSRTCGRFINLDNVNLKIAYSGRPMTCPSCMKTQVCISCKAPWHAGITCREFQSAKDIGSAELAKVASNFGWKLCPCCRTFVELIQGCNHITCVCRAEFCYACGATWKTCRCPLFSVSEENREMQRRLHVQEQVLGRRIAVAERQVMRRQIQRVECDRHRTYKVHRNCGNCRNCGFYMNCYGYVCRDCSNAFCFVCVMHRM